MADPKPTKLIRIDESIWSEVSAMADFQRRTIKSVTEHLLMNGIKKKQEENETKD
jgi:hypothetical protein|tara:strand:+ start:280 stop:444 length:165 start_codon:yes stop_codon:yes gene_type:complete